MTEPKACVVEVIVVEEQVVFTLAGLCRACGAAPEELAALVHEGVLLPTGDDAQSWRFSGPSLRQARTALRLARELDIGLQGAAVVMDLLAEIATLRARLRWAGVA